MVSLLSAVFVRSDEGPIVVTAVLRRPDRAGQHAPGLVGDGDDLAAFAAAILVGALQCADC